MLASSLLFKHGSAKYLSSETNRGGTIFLYVSKYPQNICIMNDDFRKSGQFNGEVKIPQNITRRCFSLGTLYRIALVLVIIGAINWGLIGFFRFDLVTAIFGGLNRWIFALVGLAGLASIPILGKALDESEGPISNASTNSQNGTAYRNPRYQTEIAEEEDFSFSEQREYDAKNKNNNSNSSSNSNSNQKK